MQLAFDPIPPSQKPQQRRSSRTSFAAPEQHLRAPMRQKQQSRSLFRYVSHCPITHPALDASTHGKRVELRRPQKKGWSGRRVAKRATRACLVDSEGRRTRLCRCEASRRR
eukprot:2487814-Rhodomonas_salina.1